MVNRTGFVLFLGGGRLLWGGGGGGGRNQGTLLGLGNVDYQLIEGWYQIVVFLPVLHTDSLNSLAETLHNCTSL